MLKVGLTGGIGAGKSEVSRLLVECGAVLIDADRIAREVVAPGTPGLAAVVDAFGEGVLAPDGSLDRPKLGSLVFADPDKLATLNAIVHPRVAELFRQRVAALEAQGVPLACYDVPLLFERNLQHTLRPVVVVNAAPDLQLARLMARNGLNGSDAEARKLSGSGARWSRSDPRPNASCAAAARPLSLPSTIHGS